MVMLSISRGLAEEVSISLELARYKFFTKHQTTPHLLKIYNQDLIQSCQITRSCPQSNGTIPIAIMAIRLVLFFIIMHANLVQA